MAKDQICRAVGEQKQVYALTEEIVQPAVPAISPAAVSSSIHPGGKTNKPYKFFLKRGKKKKKKKNECAFRTTVLAID